LPLALVLTIWQLSIVQAAPKKIVLIAGKKSHGPEGNGIHDYPWSVKLLKVMLDNYAEGKVDRVFLAYNEFKNIVSQRPVLPSRRDQTSKSAHR